MKKLTLAIALALIGFSTLAEANDRFGWRLRFGRRSASVDRSPVHSQQQQPAAANKVPRRIESILLSPQRMTEMYGPSILIRSSRRAAGPQA